MRERAFFRHITQAFGRGDFTIPNAVHSQDPSGVPTLKELKDVINYQFRETEKGGLVRVFSKSAEAVSAIHQFLRFQIKEHETGDSPEVTDR
jgi:hypothetical protein